MSLKLKIDALFIPSDVVELRKQLKGVLNVNLLPNLIPFIITASYLSYSEIFVLVNFLLCWI